MRLALTAATLAIAATPALAHHPAPEVPPGGEQLIDAYTTVHTKARLTPRVHAGRDVWSHGRPSDGRVSWPLMRRETKRLLIALRPGPQREHRRRAREAARASYLGGVFAAIRACESGGNYATNTGNGFYGAYQFTLGTWRAVGGSGYPHQASPAEQDKRAAILYAGGAGAGHWPNCP